MNSEKVYLSVDCDFWNVKTFSYTSFFDKLISLNIPIKIVDSHEYLLPFINKNVWDKIINIDFHSDITDIKNLIYSCYMGLPNVMEGRELKPECGSWVNYVNKKTRSTGEFLWIYSIESCYSSCYTDYNRNKVISRGIGRCDAVENPFVKPAVAEWENVSRKCLKKLPSERFFKSISEVGIALSLEYTDEDLLKEQFKYFQSRKLL